MGRKGKASGQRPGGSFLALPHAVLESPAWRTLSLRARAVLIEIGRRHRGFNNGEIGAGQRELATAIGSTSCRDIGTAIIELIDHGLLEVGAAENRGRRLARQYRLTWLPTGEPPHRKEATNEWRAFSGADVVSAWTPSRADVA